jgi:glycosyltransferase involved in cell wall biosynthesis
MAHALDKVVEVGERLRDYGDIRILFAGAGAARDGLIEQAQRLGLSNIVFMPMQPKERVPDIWSLCNVALVHLKDDPAFAEVIPSKIFEAMAMGLPVVIAAPAGEATEIVAAENAGIVLPPENPDALTEAVRALRVDPGRARQLGQNALTAAPRYSREKQASEMIEVFDAAIGVLPTAPGEAM